jgi:hypothetical protein
MASLPNQANPIIDYWVSSPDSLTFPDGQTNAKRKWKATLMYASPWEVEETNLTIDRKLRLTDMLTLLIEQLSVNQPDDMEIIDCGFKIW